jgi:hypothetical protein
MRFAVAVILLCGAAAPSDAGASSLIVLEPAKDAVGPSTVALGALSSATSAGAGRSILVVGEPGPAVSAVPPVSDEKLSSIGAPAEKRGGPAAAPMVIRGGIIGDAFVRNTSPSAAEPPQPSTVEAPTPGRIEAEEPVVGPSADSELDLQ